VPRPAASFLLLLLLAACGCSRAAGPGSEPEPATSPVVLETLRPLWERVPALAELLTPSTVAGRAAGSAWKEAPSAKPAPACQELRLDPPPTARAPSGAADVVLITIDTWRADRLGVYGSPRATDPWMQGLAQESTVFDWAVAPAPWTWPTMVSLTSGLHPVAHGAEQHDDPVCMKAQTLPKLFSAAGWRTAMVTTNVYMKTHAASFHRGFEYYCPTNHEAAPDVVREVARTLDGFPSDDPLFLWVHLFDPHCPYQPSAEALNAVTARDFGSPRVRGGASMADVLGDTNYCYWVPPLPDSEPEAGSTARPSPRTQDYLDAYDGELRDIDESLRLLAEVLKRRGRWDNAWIAITGDHGEEFAEHGRFGHGKSLNQESTRVPLLIKAPRVAEVPSPASAGRRVTTPVSLVDLPPTLLAAVGIPVPNSWQGTDLGPALRGERMAPREVSAESYAPWSRLLISSDQRLVVQGNELEEASLFDARDDPMELNDLLAGLSLQHREERAGKLMERLRQRWKALATGRICRPAAVELSPEDVDRLRALGYLETD